MTERIPQPGDRVEVVALDPGPDDGRCRVGYRGMVTELDWIYVDPERPISVRLFNGWPAEFKPEQLRILGDDDALPEPVGPDEYLDDATYAADQEYPDCSWDDTPGAWPDDLEPEPANPGAYRSRYTFPDAEELRERAQVWKRVHIADDGTHDPRYWRDLGHGCFEWHPKRRRKAAARG